MLSSTENGKINLRRVKRAIPFAILHYNVDEIKANILCNYEWLYAKLEGTSYEVS